MDKSRELARPHLWSIATPIKRLNTQQVPVFELFRSESCRVEIEKAALKG